MKRVFGSQKFMGRKQSEKDSAANAGSSYGKKKKVDFSRTKSPESGTKSPKEQQNRKW